MDSDRDLLPEGLEDRLPAAAAAAARVTRAVIDVLDGHGYDRVQPPSIEFEKSLASRMAGVQPRRMFRFVDPASLRTLALRSDITVQVGRIAATALAAWLLLVAAATTVLTAIFMPLNLVTGFFGMNFEGLPLIHSRTGFWSIFFAMLLVGIGLSVFFWRKRYLSTSR